MIIELIYHVYRNQGGDEIHILDDLRERKDIPPNYTFNHSYTYESEDNQPLCRRRVLSAEYLKFLKERK
jgi:hypothetical protein